MVRLRLTGGTLGAVAGFDWISLCTDYGDADGFVAACHGVIARIAPHARVLDITHAVAPGDVRRGSVLLADTLPWLPAAVHVAVVDPGVGTARRGIALVSGDAVLVGPDNGLLLPAAEILGGVRAAYEVVEPAYRLETVSATFHGRDIFAPVAAHLAAGVGLPELGEAAEPASLRRLESGPPASDRGGGLTTRILSLDHFGNARLSATTEQAGLEYGGDLKVDAGDGEMSVRYVETFGSAGAGELVLVPDSHWRLSLAINKGNAAQALALRVGGTVRLIPAEDHDG